MLTVYVFDLDYTLWPCWCDTHVLPPFKKQSGNTVVDRYGYQLQLYPDVEDIIARLKDEGHILVAASRTMTPKVALKLLDLFTVKGKPLRSYFDSVQYGTGLKKKHIKQAAKEVGFEDALAKGEVALFDDESRNRDVEDINVHFAYCRDGLTNKVLAAAQRERS